MSKARDLSDFISVATVDASEIADLAITHAKLHTDMNLSSKTVTLPSAITNTITNKLPLAGGTLTGNLIIDSSSSASLTLDRVSNTTGSTIDFKTAGALKWYMGLRGLSNDNFYIRDEVGNTNALTITSGGDLFVAGLVAAVGGNANNTDAAAVFKGTGTEHLKLLLDTSSTSGHRASIALESNSNEVNIGTTGSDEMRFSTTATSDALFIKSDGKVGIGTTAPLTLLAVQQTGGNLTSGNAIKSSTMKGLTLNAQEGAAHLNSLGVWFGSNGSHWSGIAGGRSNTSTWGTDLRFYTHEDNTTDLTYSRQRMVITESGNVGIGTTAPSALLEVASGAPTIILNASGQATNKKKVRLAASQYTAGDFNIQQMNDDGTTIALTAMTIKNGGNVGINKTSPNDKLHVANGWLRVQAADQTSGSHASKYGLRWTQETDVEVARIEVERPSWSGAPSIMNFYTRTTGNAVNKNMAISQSGAVTMPYQPNFLARIATSTGALTQDAWATFNFDQTSQGWDHGSNYSTSNKRFTAPVAGIYFFHWLIQIEGITNAPAWYYAYPTINGSTSFGGSNGMTAADQIEPIGAYTAIKGTQSLNLGANDYVHLRYYWSGGNGNIKGASESMWAGHLIG